MKKSTAKIQYFEGLRGLAAFIVLLAHARPTFYLGVDRDIVDGFGIAVPILERICHSLVMLFFDGELPVNIFWFMSAYLISYGLFNSRKNENDKYLISAATKRYFRLAIPVFVSSFICFLLLYFGLFYNSDLAIALGQGYEDGWLNRWYHFEPNLVGFLKTTLIEVFINRNNNYNMVLWTMSIEMLGSMLCFSVFAIFGRHWRRIYIYVVLITVLVIMGTDDKSHFHYLLFIGGLLWADNENTRLGEDQRFNYLKLVNSVFQANFTWVVTLLVTFAVQILDWPLFKSHNIDYFFIYTVRAIAITLLVHKSIKLKTLFSTRIFVFLGKISFSLYLIHIPVLFSVGCFLYLKLFHLGGLGMFVAFGVSAVVSLLLSLLFTNLVDIKTLKWIKKVETFINTPNFTEAERVKQSIL